MGSMAVKPGDFKKLELEYTLRRNSIVREARYAIIGHSDTPPPLKAGESTRDRIVAEILKRVLDTPDNALFTNMPQIVRAALVADVVHGVSLLNILESEGSAAEREGSTRSDSTPPNLNHESALALRKLLEE